MDFWLKDYHLQSSIIYCVIEHYVMIDQLKKKINFCSLTLLMNSTNIYRSFIIMSQYSLVSLDSSKKNISNLFI